MSKFFTAVEWPPVKFYKVYFVSLSYEKWDTNRFVKCAVEYSTRLIFFKENSRINHDRYALIGEIPAKRLGFIQVLPY